MCDTRRRRTATAQTYVKLNGLYALAGVVNPAVEFAVSPHSTVQAEIVVSPWNSIRGKHMTFGILMGEYRRYFRGHNDGWYLGANIGMMAFDMSKPFLDGLHLRFEDRYCKGYGMMIGLSRGLRIPILRALARDAFWAGHGWTATTTDIVSTANRHVPPPPRPAQAPRPVQRFVRMVPQQNRRLHRLPDFQAQKIAATRSGGGHGFRQRGCADSAIR